MSQKPTEPILNTGNTEEQDNPSHYWQTIDSLSELTDDAVCNLKSSSPFSSIQFLRLLESSGSVGGDTGWQPSHYVLYVDGVVTALVPSYLKQHSYGEYVFDHAWANAYYQHGLEYYPKRIFALPFTPVTCKKVLIHQDSSLTESEIWGSLIHTIDSSELNDNSIHTLFLPKNISDNLREHNWHQRQSVQFVFYNQQLDTQEPYRDFEHFLDDLTSRKRKSIRKERKGYEEKGLTLHTLHGDDLTETELKAFINCYQITYLKRSGHHGYLTVEFFQNLHSSMHDNLMLVCAKRDEQLIAGALFFYDQSGLYGRYWGSLEDVSGLHFECCYYRGIEFCIEKQLPIFNPGTQGEHKILRGFTPTLCFSNHKMKDPRFDNAVMDFVSREAPHIREYHQQTMELLPFKQQ